MFCERLGTVLSSSVEDPTVDTGIEEAGTSMEFPGATRYYEWNPTGHSQDFGTWIPASSQVPSVVTCGLFLQGQQMDVETQVRLWTWKVLSSQSAWIK